MSKTINLKVEELFEGRSQISVEKVESRYLEFLKSATKFGEMNVKFEKVTKVSFQHTCDGILFGMYAEFIII